jgi:hypothetical protein
MVKTWRSSEERVDYGEHMNKFVRKRELSLVNTWRSYEERIHYGEPMERTHYGEHMERTHRGNKL